MAKVVVKLAMITFVSRLAWLCRSSPAESCAVGDAECQPESPRKSGDAMLQFQHKVNEEKSDGEVAARTGKGRAGKGRTEKNDVGDLYAYYAYFGIAPQPKMRTYSSSGEPGWASMVKKDLVEVNPDWVWEIGGYGFDEVMYSHHDDKDWYAYVGYPTCSGPADGFPGLVIMPGRSLKKIRHKFWVAMFASHGVVAIAPDVGKAGYAIKDSRIYLEETTEYPVNPDNIHLMGYSAGAQGVLTNGLNAANTKKFQSFTVVSGINPKKFLDHYAEPNPILLIQAQNDGMYGAAGQWDAVSGWAAEQAELDGGKTKFLAYKDGGHQPVQQASFFSEVLKFIQDPVTYTIPGDAGGLFSSGTFESSPVTEVHDKSCITNDDGIEPIITINLWSGNTGQATCLGACRQVKGCIAFDYYKKAPDGMNCALWSESCTTPTYAGGSHWSWKGYTGDFTASFCSAL